MKLLQVKAASGLSVPMEDKPRSYITDAETVSVPDSTYYQRRLSDGDLVLLEETPAAETAASVATVDAAPAADGKKSRNSKSTGE
ncbi:DUF2635 domain-containing protein [Undibacterium sp. Ren11W]|uniref:DUF2635 domain-containing protein n=1 Tax=Undibacterium sp. Ren11W TaxID=3413045 RepID=UPI003BF321E6